MTQLNDDKHCALLQLTGQASGTINDMVSSWLSAETGTTGQVNDLWNEYWDQQLIPAGQFNNRAEEWLTLKGYVGPDYNGLWAEAWADICVNGPGAAQFTMFFPLVSSLFGIVDGVNSQATFARAAGPSTVEDFEGIVHKCLDGEARFLGARRVENIVTNVSTPVSGTDWTSFVASYDFTDNTFDSPAGESIEIIRPNGSNGAPIVAGENYIATFFLEYISGNTRASMRAVGEPIGAPVVDLDLVPGVNELTTGVFTATADAATPYFLLEKDSQSDALAGRVVGLLIEKVSGSQTTPSEYISIGAGEDHGSNVDGVKYFPTDRAGGNLTGLKGIMVEDTATNHMVDSTDLTNLTLGGPIAPVITPNVGPSPEGASSSDLVLFGADANSNASFSTGGIFDPAQPFTISIWARSDDPVNNQFRISHFPDSIHVPSPNMVATTEWQRFTYSPPDAGTLNNTNVNLRNATNGAANSVEFWGFQIELADTPSTDIITTGAAATRADESLLAPKPLVMQGVIPFVRMGCVWERPFVKTSGADQFILDAIGIDRTHTFTMTHGENSQDAFAFVVTANNPAIVTVPADLSLVQSNTSILEYDGTGVATLFLNDVTGTANVANPPDLTGGTLMGIGCRADGQNTINGAVKNVVVSI